MHEPLSQRRAREIIYHVFKKRKKNSLIYHETIHIIHDTLQITQQLEL